MKLYRIVKGKHARTAFSGLGARLAGGRWNFPGETVVYCSCSLALAALETRVHVEDEGSGLSFVSFEVHVPEHVRIEILERFPKNWRAEPAGETTMRVGSKWFTAGRTVALMVPSVLIPSERNVLLNPAHPEFGGLSISRPTKFTWDPRLWK